LRQSGECGGAYQTNEKESSSQGKSRDHVHYGQAVWDDGIVLWRQATGKGGSAAAIGVVLNFFYRLLKTVRPLVLVGIKLLIF